ncbi:receptor protein kinase TMK1-like [Rutidosis leptorrhynchoides]|uniref:receptor protein kinase TMK1-like n=1 Tax=Rutidosis leptorrhynchoides TaxID=125765 RepID=UPI003A9937C8
MGKPHIGFKIHTHFHLIIITLSLTNVYSQSSSNDINAMQALKENLHSLGSLDWSDPNPCNWDHIRCSSDNRVTIIQIGKQNLKGSLPETLNNLTQLQVLELQHNQLSRSLPSLSGLTQLETLMINNNNFTTIPTDFFDGMYSLQTVYLDYNDFNSWSIPDSLQNASKLQTFSATSTNLAGKIPKFFGDNNIFSGLITLRLALNDLEGELPESLSGSMLRSLWLNGQKSSYKLNGSIGVLEHMTQLTEVWLHGNMFSGSLPDFSRLNHLQDLSLRDNILTGPVPASLVGLKSLKVVKLGNNLLQGPMPKFDDDIVLDTVGIDSFCLQTPGIECDSRVNLLLSVVEPMGYPQIFAKNWKGNDPCDLWLGITCSINGDITVVNFRNMGLTGTISSSLGSIKSLQRLILADNNLAGVIPNELKDLPNLVELDVSNNQLYGKVPIFKDEVKVNSDGNPDINKDGHKFRVIFSFIIGMVLCVIVVLLLVAVCTMKCKKKDWSEPVVNNVVTHPQQHSDDPDGVNITISSANNNDNDNNNGSQEIKSPTSSGPSDVHRIEAGNVKLFQDNKRSKTVELTAELHSLHIGDQTAESYFQKIDSIASMLHNLGSKIEEDELVTYAINGLDDRFTHATHIILHTIRSRISILYAQ